MVNCYEACGQIMRLTIVRPAEWFEFPQTNASLPFGTVVQRNVLANLHDHLSGEAAPAVWQSDICQTLQQRGNAPFGGM